MLQQKLRAALVVPGEKRSNRFFRLFPWVWLVVAYCVTMLVLCLYGRNYIDSDMASEMVLADLLNKEGGLLTTQWWYSTELRVFYVQIFYRLGLLLFPHSWYAARMVGQGLCMLVLIVSYLYMGHGLKLRQCGVWGAAALACPFGVWYLWYGAFAGAYLPHMILILLSFGAILHLVYQPKTRIFPLHILILLISSGASGLNSIKGLMAFYLPMLFTALLALGLQWQYQAGKCPRRELCLLGITGATVTVAACGYVFNSTVLAAGHSFSNYNDRTWNVLDLNALVEKWADFLSLFGYPVDQFLGGRVTLFSLEGILASCGLLTAGAIVFSLFRLLLRLPELDRVQRLAPLLLVSICLIQGAIFTFAAGDQLVNASYWLTVLPFVFPVLQLEGETEHFHIPHIRRVAALTFCVCIVSTSISAGMRFFSNGYRTNPHLAEVCSWLENEGYTQGYATFWNGNVLTEWSDGQIDVWVTSDFNTLEIDHWLQKTRHTQPPEGPVFLLTTMQELNSMNLTQLYWWSNIVYEEGEEIKDKNIRYVVLEYSNYDDMVAAIQGAQSWAEIGYWGEG